MTDQPGLAIWECENCAILRYHCVGKLEISRRLPQVRKDAASDEDYHDPARACLRDCGLDVRVERTVSCDGPVVVKRQHPKLHDCLCLRALMSGTVRENILTLGSEPWHIRVLVACWPILGRLLVTFQGVPDGHEHVLEI